MLKSQTGVKWSGMKDDVVKVADILIGMVVRIGIQMNIIFRDFHHLFLCRYR